MFAREPDAAVPLGVLIGHPITVAPRVRLRYPVNGKPHRARERSSTCWRTQRVTHLDCSFTRRYHRLLRDVRITKHLTPLSLHARGVPWRTLDRMKEAGCLETMP